jgi:hypothetical protein
VLVERLLVIESKLLLDLVKCEKFHISLDFQFYKSGEIWFGVYQRANQKEKKQTPHHCGVCEEFTKKEMPLHFLFRITK